MARHQASAWSTEVHFGLASGTFGLLQGCTGRQALKLERGEHVVLERPEARGGHAEQVLRQLLARRR